MFRVKPLFTELGLKRLKTQDLLKNEQFGKTTTKLKVGDGRWKLSKFTKNWLEVIFVTKQQNQFLSIKNSSFNQKLIQSASNQLKLTWNQPLWPHSKKDYINVKKLWKKPKTSFKWFSWSKNKRSMFSNSLFPKIVSKHF